MTLRTKSCAWLPTMTAISMATAGSSQYQPRAARMTAPLTATPAAASASAAAQQDRFHVRVLLAVVVIIGAAAEDDRGGQDDGRRDPSDDQHWQALAPARACGQVLDRGSGDQHVQHEQSADRECRRGGAWPAAR
jgi:hypothetical protein